MKWHIYLLPFFPCPLCVFALCSNGTLEVRGDGEGVSVRSVQSVALGAQEAALLDGPALASAPGGLSSKLRALRRIMSGSNRAAVPLSALLCRDRPARLDRSVTGAASTLRQLQFLNQAAVTGASHSDCLRK